MSKYPVKDETIGPFRGRVSGDWRSSDLLLALVRIPALINSDEAEVLTSGRNRNIKIDLVCKRQALTVVVKAFRRPSLLKNAIDRRGRGSKARRTWQAAVHLAEAGVGTPEPVAFLERWVEERLVESYVVTRFQEGISSFTHELNNLFRHEPECAKCMALMQSVADAVRAMHDTGFQHNDLGNQNILLRRLGGEKWGDVQFIDLNRGRIRGSLTPPQRARDISRLYLPSDFLRVFKDMYWGMVPPAEFQVCESRYRRRYAWHSRTRRLRHPIRESRKRRASGDPPAYPAEPDLWIWDERSGQAQTTLLSKDRRRYYPMERFLKEVFFTLKALIPVWREYRALRETAYREPVAMRGRIGISIETSAERVSRQLALLAALGPVPVCVRFYHHRSRDERDATITAVRRIHAAGHAVSIALIQDRAAVKNPAAWRAFADDVLKQVSGIVECVEIGHAINRVKWGIWGLAEYRRLVMGVSVLRAKYPDLTLTGPAVIDFECPYVLAALGSLPPSFRFGALSHHLYVDRRGAPENRQGLFSALEKFMLVRAIARRSEHCEDRFIVSEVNWPLAGTGIHSPVGSPYVSPGLRLDDPSVSEDDYADYMIRYLLIALCSGMVEQVYWWRLVAFGYGLVDDSDPEQWRERPAFAALCEFLQHVGDATFERRHELNDDGAVAFVFRREDGRRFRVAYTSGKECEITLPGATVPVKLSGRPVYVEDGSKAEIRKAGPTSPGRLRRARR
jgi:tRNA A-37 threonylcarbamoyl transferase component Bud32